MRLLRRNWFLLGVLASLAAAYLAPCVGKGFALAGGKDVAILLIFFLAGLTVRLRSIGEDARRWPIHLLIQGFSFALIPALFYYTSFWMPDGPAKYGVLLVACVPTTVSSCVAFTAASRGRTSCALLNAVGGNLIGVVLSPLLLGLAVGRHGSMDAAAGRAVVKLCWFALAPFALGHISGAFWLKPSRRVSGLASYASQVCILLIMLAAFSKSLSDLTESLGRMWTCFIYVVAAHLVFVGLAMVCVRLFRIAPAVAAAVVFCSTQKTLGLGLPLADAFFEGSDIPVAVVYLPLIVYHFFQLAFGGFLVSYWSKRTRESASST